MKTELYTISPRQTQSNSPAATFCTVLGVLTWIGGLIIAISAGNATAYYSGFSFVGFLPPFIISAVSGGLMLCMAELFRNVQIIADSVSGMRVIGEKPEVKPVAAGPRETKPATVSNKVPASSNSKDTAGEMNEIDKDAEAVIPIVVDKYMIKCPNCETEQINERNCCYRCGVHFIKE